MSAWEVMSIKRAWRGGDVEVARCSSPRNAGGRANYSALPATPLYERGLKQPALPSKRLAGTAALDRHGTPC